jgi:aspartate/methionine/tyrosine aminotransferase
MGADMNQDRFISQRARGVEASGIRRMFELATKMSGDRVDFSIGQPDFQPPEAVKQAAIAAIHEGYSGYTVTQGIPQLREAIRPTIRELFNYQPDVLITCGVSGGILLAMMASMNPGDEVILIDPYFILYKQVARMIGCVSVPVSSYPRFEFPADAVAKAITPRTRMLLVNSPCNPTGVVMTDAECRAAAELAAEHDLLLVSDEIYYDLWFDRPAPSPVRFAPERSVLLRGFGKSYGMTGWRLGYAAGPDWLIQQMAKLQQYTYVCAPSIAQHAGVAALQEDVSHHARDYAAKRDLACGILQDHFEFIRPGGGFYVFPKAPPAYEHATAFVEAAAKREVLIIPGGFFSERDTHFRLSIATSNANIRRGCEILCQVATP